MTSSNCFEPDRLWAVTSFRGTHSPRRCFGTGMTKAQALARAELVGRLFPEMANPRVSPCQG